MVSMSQKNCNVLCWNVQGLNASNRRDSVRNAVTAAWATIVCLQETKIERWTSRLVRDTLGPQFVNSFASLPANGVRGGILLAVNELFFTMQNIHTTTHTISTDLVMRADNAICTVTGVYGPQENNDKEVFLDEIKDSKQRGQREWLILGDFNLIYKAEDKNNNRLNRSLMIRFKETLDDA
jgi:exonuclease III